MTQQRRIVSTQIAFYSGIFIAIVIFLAWIFPSTIGLIQKVFIHYITGICLDINAFYIPFFIFKVGINVSGFIVPLGISLYLVRKLRKSRTRKIGTDILILLVFSISSFLIGIGFPTVQTVSMSTNSKLSGVGVNRIAIVLFSVYMGYWFYQQIMTTKRFNFDSLYRASVKVAYPVGFLIGVLGDLSGLHRIYSQLGNNKAVFGGVGFVDLLFLFPIFFLLSVLFSVFFIKVFLGKRIYRFKYTERQQRIN